MSAAADRQVIAAIANGADSLPALRKATSLAAADARAAVQRLRFQGKIEWGALCLSPSMLVGGDDGAAEAGEEDSNSAAGGTRPGAAEGTADPAAAVEPGPPERASLARTEPVQPSRGEAARLLLAEIEDYLARTGSDERKFGALLCRAQGYVALLRKRELASEEMAAKARALIAAYPAGLSDVTMPNCRTGSAERSLAEQVREEAEVTAARRRSAKRLTTRHPLDIAPASLGEQLQIALVEEPGDLVRAVNRRHPVLIRRAVALGRHRGESFAAALFSALERGLDQMERESGRG